MKKKYNVVVRMIVIGVITGIAITLFDQHRDRLEKEKYNEEYKSMPKREVFMSNGVMVVRVVYTFYKTDSNGVVKVIKVVEPEVVNTNVE